MEKKTVEVGFVDFWPGFDPADNFIVAALSERYEVVVSERPQILFFSCFGQRFTGYDCVRVFYTPENLVPDFNVADYAIGFHYLDFGRRYLRYPIYHAYGYDGKLIDYKVFTGGGLPPANSAVSSTPTGSGLRRSGNSSLIFSLPINGSIRAAAT